MKILSIETSCDETAVSIVEAEGELNSPSFSILGNALFSQVDIHKEFGGVFPKLAKREHIKNLPPLTEKALKEAGFWIVGSEYPQEKWSQIEAILSREEGLFEVFKTTFGGLKKPDIDCIGVTAGPGLEPALWVGISFAKALGNLWDLPVIPANHMEGHITSVLVNTEKTQNSNKIEFPALAVLISGGHTEIIKINSWGKYKVIGQTRDDAVGEAFDKTARMLGLPYPGGPEVSKIAEYAREKNIPKKTSLPRPMINSKDLNFSFSGLKTAVLYYIRDNFGDKELSQDEKADIAREFEDAVLDILYNKTKQAIEENEVKTLIVGGGVIANKKIREVFFKFGKEYENLLVKIPENSLSTDNSIMIASAVYINIKNNPDILLSTENITAKGNLSLE